MNTMTIKEIAELTGTNRSTIQRWASKVTNPMQIAQGIKTKLSEAETNSSPAEFTLEETIGIIRAGGKNLLADLLLQNAEKSSLPMVQDPTDPGQWAVVVQELAGRFIEASKEIQALRPIAAAHQILTDSEGACTMAELAKNIGMGEYKLFGELRDANILISGGPSHNLPFQEYMDRGWFRVRAINIPRTKGSDLKRQTLITPKGQSEIAKLFTRQLEAT